MFSFTRKIAIVVSLVSLYCGQFVAFGSMNNTNIAGATDSRKRTAVVEASSGQNSLQLVADDSASNPVQHDQFFPGFQRDMKLYLAGLMSERNNPLILAQVNKAWHSFFLGEVFAKKNGTVKNGKIEWPPIPLSARSDLVQESVRRWWAEKDLQILNSGTFRYQPEGKAAINVSLSNMTANGELVLPPELAQLPLCVMRNPQSFVNPEGDNTSKTLVLLLTLSELKNVAPQICTDASFIQTVDQADLSQNAVCALIRHGGENLATWGFRYTILRFKEMNDLSVRLICVHEKARGRLGWIGMGNMRHAFEYFIFEPELVVNDRCSRKKNSDLSIQHEKMLGR